MAQSEGSFVRWQQIRLEQLGTTVHVILTLSTGALAYVASLVLGKDALPLSTAAEILIGPGAFLLLLSVGAGLWVHRSRLNDFRWTARTARIRDIGKEKDLHPGTADWPRWLYEESSVSPERPEPPSHSHAGGGNTTKTEATTGRRPTRQAEGGDELCA